MLTEIQGQTTRSRPETDMEASPQNHAFSYVLNFSKGRVEVVFLQEEVIPEKLKKIMSVKG